LVSGCTSTKSIEITEPIDNKIVEVEIDEDDTSGLYDFSIVEITSNGTEPFQNFTA
jgi:hypothetical protein